MKRLFTVLSLAVAVLAMSCSKDTTTDELLLGGGGNNTETPDEGPMKYITIGIEDTRIAVGEESDGKVPLYWSEGDQLVVNKTKTSGAVAAEDAGKQSAVIGVPAETTYPMTLVYPSAVRKGAKWFFIDAEQTYNPAKLANGWAILMGVAENEGDVVVLEHKCGYMKVSLTGSTTVKRVMLRAMGHEPLSGYFRFPTTSATDGTIGMERFNGDNALANGCFDSPLVAINCGEGVALSGEATDFYFALPVANYSKGFALTIIDTEGKQHRVTAYTSGKQVEAGALIEMPTLAVNCTEDQGIYNGNELAGYVRTLEKDVWLDVTDGATLHIRGEADLSGESFNDLEAELQESRVAGELFYWRDPAAEEDTYNCLSITTIDGHNNAITGYNSTVTAEAAGLLFHEIPATMTVKNLSLGKTADNPTTADNEADCTLTATGSGTSNNCFGAFCYNLLGTIENCANYAKVDIQSATTGGLRVGGFHCGTSTSNGTVSGSTNYGYIYCDGTATSSGYVIVGGIAASDSGVFTNCTNAGPVSVVNSARTVYVGGLVGYAQKRELSGFSNSGAITLTNPALASRIGGVVGYTTQLVTSCSNTGAVTASMNVNKACHIGGVVGSNDYGSQTYNGCVNGEEGTQKGAVSMTQTGSGNIYIGGVAGCSNVIGAFDGATNYGPITVGGEKLNNLYLGGAVGYVNTASSTTKNCKNYGSINVSGKTASTSYSYLGGVVSSNDNDRLTITSCENYGDCTLNIATMKLRFGGISGLLCNKVSDCHADFDITVNQVAASSAIGGFAGYMRASSLNNCSYKGTITNNDPDANSTVTIASLFATALNATCTSTSIETTLVNNAGAPSFGLIGGAVAASKTLKLGAADKPFQISTKSKFLGIDVSESTVTNHRTDEGASGKAYLDCSADANKFTITKTNLVYVSSID